MHLDRNSHLEVEWPDGLSVRFELDDLRAACPCAMCKQTRQERAATKSRLNVLPGNFVEKMSVKSAEMVGNYALRIEWSDDHGSGIYSFTYLRELADRKRSTS
jgi:DUF971 family protein